ncbi:cytochrome c [Acetobacter conturbans]|uniref:C-type cytochrome n=1 Tax=Acetobacter conturbans TaxID=1737472 RepID=A0ABX0K376_9PROT|nr:cytochrome c [Acetobacter conturbans]NHN89715.1 c-type cytochrome [Acetobacter conturbans]
MSRVRFALCSRILPVIMLTAVPTALCCAGLSAIAAAFAADPTGRPANSDPDLIRQGEYMARAADCAACHSVRGQPPYSGGVPFDLPMGRIYSPNITPDPDHGIGHDSEEQFARAIREGVRHDGASMYPAMPFPSYARLTDADVHALFVYFRYGVKPLATTPPASTIIWPLSMRWPLIFWRGMFAPAPQVALKTTRRTFPDTTIARGAYLVEGPGHCGACHTPRALTLQEKALTAADGPLYLSGGGAVDGWHPPSLRQENRTGLGRWSEDDIVAFLREAGAPLGSAFGGMADAVEHGTQYLTDNDLHAIARYLRSLQPTRMPDPAWRYDPATETALRQGDVTARGARVYVDHCAACHRDDGRGYPTVFPPLAGNPVVMDDRPDSLVAILFKGAVLPATRTAPSSFVMPSFVRSLSPQQMADVLSFIRSAWGNDAPPVDVETVRKLTPTGGAPAIREMPLN